MERLEDRLAMATFGQAFSIGEQGEWARDIAADSAGNTYITGYFSGEVDFDPTSREVKLTSSLVPNPQSPTGYSYAQEGFVAKYDPTGACAWAVRLGSSHSESIALDALQTSLAVTGQFTGTALHGPFTLTSSGAYDAFVTQIDAATGSVSWANRWGGSYDNDTGFGVAFDPSGNVYATGRLDLSGAVTPQNLDVLVVKYDANGDLQWSRQVGGSSIDTGMSIVTDSSGNVIVGGDFIGTVDFDPSAGTYALTSGGGRGNPAQAGFVMKLTSSGALAWADHFQAGRYSTSQVKDVQVDGNGNVYAIGLADGTVDFNPAKKATFNVSTSYDGFAVTLSSQGQFVWAKTFGGTSNFDVYGAALDAAGSLYITGSYYGTADFDPGSGVFSRSSAGDEDVFVMKLNSNGGFEWAATMGGVGQDRGQALAVDDSGNVYVVGLFFGHSDFDPDLTGEYFLDANPGYAMFWVKLRKS
jgi:hypothetical protein